MQRNVRLSGLRNVVLEPKAVSNEPGSIRLFLSEKNKGDHRIYQPEGEQRDFIEVEAVPLDAYFDGVEESVDFVKIDTQGAELVILEGMLDLVKRSGSLVMAIEYSPHHLAGFGATGAELLDVLGSLDLAMFDLGAGGAGLQRIKPVRPRSLLLNFSPKWTSFTNLLLVKGRSDILAKIRSQGPTP
jgi:FkbM family methyltransferase